MGLWHFISDCRSQQSDLTDKWYVSNDHDMAGLTLLKIIRGWQLFTSPTKLTIPVESTGVTVQVSKPRENTGVNTSKAGSWLSKGGVLWQLLILSAGKRWTGGNTSQSFNWWNLCRMELVRSVLKNWCVQESLNVCRQNEGTFCLALSEQMTQRVNNSQYWPLPLLKCTIPQKVRKPLFSLVYAKVFGHFEQTRIYDASNLLSVSVSLLWV